MLYLQKLILGMLINVISTDFEYIDRFYYILSTFLFLRLYQTLNISTDSTIFLALDVKGEVSDIM